MPFDVALATTHPCPAKESTFCKYCKLYGHKLVDCPTIECMYCLKRGHILDNCPTRPPRPSGHSHKPKSSSKTSSQPIVVVATSSDITAPHNFQLNDFHELLK